MSQRAEEWELESLVGCCWVFLLYDQGMVSTWGLRSDILVGNGRTLDWGDKLRTCQYPCSGTQQGNLGIVEEEWPANL